MKSKNSNIDSLVDLRTVKHHVHKGKTWIYSQMAQGKFPRAIKIGRSSLWSLDELADYIETVKSGNEWRS